MKLDLQILLLTVIVLVFFSSMLFLAHPERYIHHRRHAIHPDDHAAAHMMQAKSLVPSSSTTRLPRTPSVQALPPVSVLAWNGAGLWTGLGHDTVWKTPNYVGYAVKREKCPVDCTFTTDMTRVSVVDAVLFEASVWGKGHELDFLREPIEMPERLYGQQFVNFGFETPLYFPLLAHPVFQAQMTMNVTYDRMASAVPISFTCSWAGVPPHELLEPRRKHTDPTKVAALMVSNCVRGGALNRHRYVAELMQHISVHSFGHCHHNQELPPHMQVPIYANHGESMRNKIKTFGQYKFALAFENSNTTDYVSEKLWNALQSGALPIYMGSANIDDYLPADHAVIRTDQFASPKALADYLHYLLANDTAYEEYFAWRKTGRLRQSYLDRVADCAFTQAPCRLCVELATRKARAMEAVPTNRFSRPLYHVVLNGQDQYGEVDHDPAFNLRDNFTIMAWIQEAGAQDGARIVDKNTAGTIDGYNFDVVRVWERDYLRFCGGDACRVSQTPMSPGGWHHVAVVLERPALYFYVDGVRELFHESVRLPVMPTTRPFRIGAASVPSDYPADAVAHWHGALDDVAVFGRALSEARVRHWMLSRPSGHAGHAEAHEDNLQSWYDFNDMGTTRRMQDVSGYNRHGEWRGSAATKMENRGKRRISIT